LIVDRMVGILSGRRYAVGVALAVLFLFACTARLDGQAPATKVDRIVIEKSKREMMLMSGGKAVKTYKVALGSEPVGPKEQRGDHKTPEGVYAVDAKVAQSEFHRALHLSYPSAADRERARKMGVSPGGDVEIHGLGAKWGWVGAAHQEYDWTDGCVAVTNQEIDEIWPLVPVRTPVEIRP
jgi:murein L,D-transpeptidase YafK